MTTSSLVLPSPCKTILTPEQFAEEGFTAVDGATGVGSRDFLRVEDKLLRLIAAVPELAARPPRPYQLRYASLAATRTNNLLAHEAGVGKSYEFCLLVLALYGEMVEGALALPGLKPGTIHLVAPKHTLKLVWLNKELKRTGLAPFAEIITDERSARLSNKPIWLYHYDLLKRQTERGRRSGRSKAVGHPLYKLLRSKYAPGLLALDEIHRLRAGSDRTRAMQELRKNAKRVLGLTGTPMDGWVEHLASILAVVYKENSPEFPYTVARFTKRFTRTELASRDFVTGADDRKAVKKRPAPGIAVDQLPAFHQATAHLIHRLTFKDAEVSPHVHFPKMDHQVLDLPPDAIHLAYYHQVHVAMITRISDAIHQLDAGKQSRAQTRVNVLTHLNALRAAADCPWELNPAIATTAKLEAIKAICLQTKAETRKIIIYTNRIACGNRLHAVLEAAGVKTLRIYDTDAAAKPKKLSQDDRDTRIETFQEDDSITALVGNLGLISEGLTLVEASKVIHHDHDWRALGRSQGNNRVVRPGQSYDPVPVWDTVLQGTVNGYVYGSMMRKASATAQILDKEFDVGESAVIDPIELARQLISTETQIETP